MDFFSVVVLVVYNANKFILAFCWPQQRPTVSR